MRFGRFLTILTLALLLLTSACASSTDSPDTTAIASDAGAADDSVDATTETGGDSDSASDSGASADTTDDPATDDGSTDDGYVSPIGLALGLDFDDQVNANNTYVRAAEALIRECMAEAGFDYVPNDPQIAESQQRLLELQASLSYDQFVEEYGYGIATLFELDYNAEGVLRFTELIIGPAPTVPRTDAEQAAYEIALNGETIQGLDADDAQEQAFDFSGGPASEGSCRQYGYDTAEFPQGDVFDGFTSLLGADFEALNDRFEGDARIVAAQAKWQTCMAEAGHAFENAQDVRTNVNEAAFAIGNTFSTAPETLLIFQAAIDADISSMNTNERTEFLEREGAFKGMSLVPGLQAELDELKQRELELARDDRDCTDQDLLDQVRIDLEAGFVEEHADQLELIAAGAGAG